MKHSLKITLILVFIFLTTQIIGLATINKYIKVTTQVDGTINVFHPDTAVGRPPVAQEKSYSFLPIIIAVLLGTGLVFLLIKFRLGHLWKYWFLMAVCVSLSVSFGVYLKNFIAIPLAIILGLLKTYRKNVIIHNVTEIFIYSGIAIMLLGMLNIYSAVILLLLISVYDFIAVWKSGHMIELAKFQSEQNMFAGLFIPYTLKQTNMPNIKNKKSEKGIIKESNVSNAILGGGDIAFPMLFAAAVMEHLILNNGVEKIFAFYQSLIIALTSSIALLLLFLKSKKNKFYPAMPFISAGCFVGYGIIILLNY